MQLEVALTERRAKAEDEGLDEEEDREYDLRLVSHCAAVWYSLSVVWGGTVWYVYHLRCLCMYVLRYAAAAA